MRVNGKYIPPMIYVGMNTRRRDITGIIVHIANVLDVDLSLMLSKTRKRKAVEARQIAMYLIRYHSEDKNALTLSQIGASIGAGYDHATVLHACKNVKNLVETDKEFRNKFNRILESLPTDGIVNPIGYGKDETIKVYANKIKNL